MQSQRFILDKWGHLVHFEFMLVVPLVESLLTGDRDRLQSWSWRLSQWCLHGLSVSTRLPSGCSRFLPNSKDMLVGILIGWYHFWFFSSWIVWSVYQLFWQHLIIWLKHFMVLNKFLNLLPSPENYFSFSPLHLINNFVPSPWSSHPSKSMLPKTEQNTSADVSKRFQKAESVTFLCTLSLSIKLKFPMYVFFS